MQVQIYAPGESLPDAFLERVERRVEEVLATHAEKLTRVEVHFRDLNGQKGGIDKRCVIEARPRGLDPVAASHEDTDVADAFRGALDRLHRVLERRFGKLSSRGG